LPGAAEPQPAHGALRALPANQIVVHIVDAAERWRNADFPPRVRATAAIEERLGYTTPVVDYALDRLFGAITGDALEAAIVSELGALDALDGVIARHGAPAGWARGVDRATIVSSDTTIGVALAPAIFALCAKCDVTVKDRSDALIAGFFATLADEHPAFASAALARPWPGGDDPGEAPLLAASDVVVAFGSDDALQAIRTACNPGARFVPFGHRISLGRLTSVDVASLQPATAELIARDALLYDGEGCLSLHALFVEAAGDEIAHCAALLAAACERITVEFPAGVQPPRRVAAATAYRSLAAFRAAGGVGNVLLAGDATLVVEPPLEDAPPLLPRIVPIFTVGGDDAIAAYAAAHRLPVQALGVVTPDAAAVALAARIGAVRVAPFGTLQDPPLAGHHGGVPRIADFVRWIDRA